MNQLPSINLPYTMHNGQESLAPSLIFHGKLAVCRYIFVHLCLSKSIYLRSREIYSWAYFLEGNRRDRRAAPLKARFLKRKSQIRLTSRNTTCTIRESIACRMKNSRMRFEASN